MSRQNAPNFTKAGFTFPYATSADDVFLKEDVQGMAVAVSAHDHSEGLGLAVSRVASGLAGARPAATGAAGLLYVATDIPANLAFSDGSIWIELAPESGASLTNPTTDEVNITGPAAIASSRIVGVVTATGAPTSGTWQTNDLGWDEGGGMYLCTVGGTPGTWIQVGGAMTGDVKTTFRNTADLGWALCYGQTVDATTTPYLALWTYANANGLVGAGKPFSGTQAAMVFPDLRGMTLAGLDNMGGVARNMLSALNALGAQTGAATHTLTTGELPHLSLTATSVSTVTDPGHSHPVQEWVGSNQNGGPGFKGQTNIGSQSTDNATTGITVATVTTVTDANGGGSHSIVQPTAGVNIQVKL